jgi:hypothetical protein
LEDIGIDGSITLGWILRKQGGRVWTGFIWQRLATSEHGNEPSGSIKGGDFLDYVSGY